MQGISDLPLANLAKSRIMYGCGSNLIYAGYKGSKNRLHAGKIKHKKVNYKETRCQHYKLSRKRKGNKVPTSMYKTTSTMCSKT